MVAIVLNGITGARLHIPFSVLNRSSMGFGLACEFIDQVRKRRAIVLM